MRDCSCGGGGGWKGRVVDSFITKTLKRRGQQKSLKGLIGEHTGAVSTGGEATYIQM